jgi:hypothetical protein
LALDWYVVVVYDANLVHIANDFVGVGEMLSVNRHLEQLDLRGLETVNSKIANRKTSSILLLTLEKNGRQRLECNASLKDCVSTALCDI